LANYPEAARAVDYYLQGMYDPYPRQLDFDGVQMLRDDPSARGAMAEYLQQAAAYARAHNPPHGNFVGPNEPPAGDKSGPVAADRHPDWHKAVGGFFVKGRGRIICRNVTKAMTLTLMMGDRYNFHDNGMGLDIGPFRYVSDAQMAMLHAQGLAQAYHREGGSITVHVDNVMTFVEQSKALKAIEVAIGGDIRGKPRGGGGVRR
jgi:hypothetical protein